MDLLGDLFINPLKLDERIGTLRDKGKCFVLFREPCIMYELFPIKKKWNFQSTSDCKIL